MKYLKFIIILVQLAFLNIETYPQVNELNHEKYWYYRKRLVNEFMVSGEENTFLTCEKQNEDPDPTTPEDDRRKLGSCGLSTPAKNIAYVYNDDEEVNRWEFNYSDTTGVLGWYIGVLATELRLLYNHGQPYENTKRELYFALKAYERWINILLTKELT